MLKLCKICGREFNGQSRQLFCSGGCRLENERQKMKIPEHEKPSSQLVIRFSVLKRDGFKCIYCGRSPLHDNAVLEIEHVIPRSKGGTNEMNNLVAACRECNIGKGDRLGVDEILKALKTNKDRI